VHRFNVPNQDSVQYCVNYQHVEYFLDVEIVILKLQKQNNYVVGTMRFYTCHCGREKYLSNGQRIAIVGASLYDSKPER
jgi:hypothetical protein